MWNIFKTKSLITIEDKDFQIECFTWLLTHFGGPDFYQSTDLILPTEEFFPSKVTSEKEAADTTFRQVMKHAGLEDWPVHLEEQERDVDPLVNATTVIQNLDIPTGGTFRVSESDEVTITYNPGIVTDPAQMVAVFAHELAHYLTSNAPEPPPGGWDNWEFATDICAIFMGFGIFQANSAFKFEQFASVESVGWKSSGNGYLSQKECCYSLAIFLGLKDIPANRVNPYCDANVRGYLRKALRELESNNVIETLKRVRYVPDHTSATSNRRV